MSTEQERSAAALRSLARDVERHDREIRIAEKEAASAKETAGTAVRSVAKLTAAVDGLGAAVEALAQRRTMAAALASTVEEPAEDAIAWLTLDDAETAAEVLAELEEWLAAVYVHYPGGEVQDCWRRHGSVVEELLTLRDAYTAAWSGETGSPALRMDWHSRHRPDTAKRVNETLRSCRIEHHVLKQPAAFRPAGLRGIDDAAAVAAWWTATHGRSPDPTPTRDALAEAEARKAADRLAKYGH